MATEDLVLITAGACFSVGAILIGLAGLFPRFASRTPELWALYRSEFLIVGALLIPAAVGGAFFTAVLIAFVWRGQMEMLRLFDAPLWGPAPFVASITTIALVMAGAIGNFRLMAFALGPGMLLVALVSLGTNGKKRAAERALLSAATLIYPGLLTGLVAALRAGPNGFAWLFLVYAIVEIADAFALLFGKLFGRVHPFPRLSPKKTAEGLTAGFCFGGAGGIR
jgi:CDP-diglyceride synthetase